MVFQGIFLVVAVFTAFYGQAAENSAYVQRGDWNWEAIACAREPMKVPKKFLWGSATCEYQNSGAEHCKDSNWAGFMPKMPAHIRADHAGTAADYWNRCFADIQLIKDLKLNAFRFSLDWSMIEPIQGTWNEDALEHYDQFIDQLLANGITPMATLHHFTHPEWFEALGAFEREENTEHFVRFSKMVFGRFSDRVKLWATFNEPSIYAVSAYVRGVFPPGVRDSLRAGEVLKNLWIAHAATYKALKRLDTKLRRELGSEPAQIGVVHQHLLFKPYHETSKVERYVTDYLSQMMTTASFDFMRTGHFKFRSVPMIDMMLGGLILPHHVEKTIEYDLPGLQNTYDFVGLNYYSEVRLNFLQPHKNPFFDPSDPDDIATDMPYSFRPEGLYNAIVDTSVCGKPIYITENGVADVGHGLRGLWIKRHLHAVNCALQDGYDVRGYFYWSLLDNLEWDEGFKMRFGLYEVDFDAADKPRRLRPGALVLRHKIEHAQLLDIT